MIRLILVILFIFLFLILTVPLMLICYITERINKKTGDRMSLAIVNFGWHILMFFSGTKVNVIGRENIPDDTAVLYVSNHRSYFDIVTCYPLVKGPTGFIAKKEMKKAPLFNIWMALLHCLFLDRSSTRAGAEMILKAIDYIKNGVSIFVYPEGTRKRDYTDDELLPIHNGSFKIATKSGAPIIPVTVSGTENAFEAHLPWIKKTRVTVEFGKPVIYSELEKDDQKNIGAYVGNIIHETYLKNTGKSAE